MNPTSIEWCDRTWNPVTGCSKGCAYCYALRHVARFAPGARPAMGGYVELTVPYRDQKGHTQPWPHGFEPTFHSYRLGEPALEPKPQRIFVSSMGDLLGSWVPAEWILRVLEVVRACAWHDFLFLTKNPARYAEFNPWPDNAWLGASATNQAELDVALAALAKAEAWPRFLSCEPLRGAIELPEGAGQVVDWIIIGAQTGPGAVVPRERWVHRLTWDAVDQGIQVFHKDNLLKSALRGQKLLRQAPGVARARRVAGGASC